MQVAITEDHQLEVELWSTFLCSMNSEKAFLTLQKSKSGKVTKGHPVQIFKMPISEFLSTEKIHGAPGNSIDQSYTQSSPSST